MQYCLSKREIDFLVDNDWVLPEEEEFKQLLFFFEQCKYWEKELVCFSYFLSQTIERKTKAGADCNPSLDKAFTHSLEMWFSIQQFDEEFIRYLFRHVKDKSASLEDSLIEIQNNFGEHIYE